MVEVDEVARWLDALFTVVDTIVCNGSLINVIGVAVSMDRLNGRLSAKKSKVAEAFSEVLSISLTCPKNDKDCTTVCLVFNAQLVDAVRFLEVF